MFANGRGDSKGLWMNRRAFKAKTGPREFYWRTNSVTDHPRCGKVGTRVGSERLEEVRDSDLSSAGAIGILYMLGLSVE